MMNEFTGVQEIETDVLIIGGGVAGMMAAAGAVRNGVRPLLVTKGTYASGSSSMARGGHSVVVGHADADDTPAIFAADTLQGGCGLNNPRLVDVMCREATARTLELDAWGFKYREGVPLVIYARSTVLATGGAPQLHALNDSPPTITGDGYAMAWRAGAGAELIDMEFIDYQMITAALPKLAGFPPHSSGFLNEGGIHGANRLGGAALIDSYVFGYRAGIAAAGESRARQTTARADHWRQALVAATEWSNRPAGRVKQGDWRGAVQELVVSSVGQVRRGDRLTSALAGLDALESDFAEVQIEGESPRQRFDCARRCLETRNLIQVVRMLGTAALQREESRGGHFRLDFPDTDDARFQRNIVVWNENGRVRSALRPVPDDGVAGEPPLGISSAAAMIPETV